MIYFGSIASRDESSELSERRPCGRTRHSDQGKCGADPIRLRNEIEAEVTRLREMKDFAIPNQPHFSPAHQGSPSPPVPLPEAGRGEQEKKDD